MVQGGDSHIASYLVSMEIMFEVMRMVTLWLALPFKER